MSKKLFNEGKELESYGYDDMPTYEQVMNRHKKTQSQPTPIEAVNQIRELRGKISSIQSKITELKSHASSNLYAFENPFNAPLSVCIEMINVPSCPYFYISPLIKSDYIKRFGYEGEEFANRTCVRNPVFDWDSKEGKTLKYKEKKFYEYE